MLLVLGAKPAIERATAVGLRAELGRHFALEAEFHAVVLPHVGANEILAHAMRRAAFAKINAALAGDDFGRNQGQALGAQALSHAQKHMVTQLHLRPSPSEARAFS